jgi:hypothetical protein
MTKEQLLKAIALATCEIAEMDMENMPTEEMNDNFMLALYEFTGDGRAA